MKSSHYFLDRALFYDKNKRKTEQWPNNPNITIINYCINHEWPSDLKRFTRKMKTTELKHKQHPDQRTKNQIDCVNATSNTYGSFL